jgi:hypothetical protein
LTYKSVYEMYIPNHIIGEGMNITNIVTFLNSKGFGKSYQTIYSFLTGRSEMSFKTAHSLSKVFPEKGILEFKNLSPDDLISFFYSILPDDIKHKGCHNTKWRIENIKKRYGPDILEDLEKSKSNPFFTHIHIAGKYNISREYVGQLYRIVYGNRYNSDDKKTLREEELSCSNNPNRKVAEYKKSGSIYQGAITEKLFMCKCELLGFDVSIPCKSDFDIVVNGWKIDVKSSIVARTNGRHLRIKYNRFTATKKQRDVCHFFACYSEITETFFIIPNEDIGKNIGKTKTFYITPKKATCCAAKNRYHKYENRFDLLETNNKDTTV